jgi:hypothetical protein
MEYNSKNNIFYVFVLVLYNRRIFNIEYWPKEFGKIVATFFQY